jgi:hypothetical protein
MNQHQRFALLARHAAVIPQPLPAGVKHRQAIAKARRDVAVNKLLPLLAVISFPPGGLNRNRAWFAPSHYPPGRRRVAAGDFFAGATQPPSNPASTSAIAPCLNVILLSSLLLCRDISVFSWN